MLKELRENPPSELGGSKITTIKDYKSSISKDFISGTTENIDLPSSNVLQFFTEDGSIISARPSGTEPKVKFYCSVNAPLSGKDDYQTVSSALESKLQLILKDLGVV